MSNSDEVVLQAAGAGEVELISNLLQLYAYDLSEVYQLSPGADGRFAYDKLPLYWSEPDQRFPLLIRHGTAVAGFALVTRGSPASDDPRVHDVAEFFVLRSRRRFGVGQKAAVLLWDRFPGPWTVRVSVANAAALSFWSKVISEYSGNTAQVSSRPNRPHDWQVFLFERAQ